MTLKEIKDFYQKQLGKKEQIEKDLIQLQKSKKENKKSLKRHEKAKEIIRIVGLETQKQLQFHISDITSLALDSVFSDPYKLKLDFVERRGKTECDILFERNGNTITPKDASGFGTLDIASLALRIASWSMSEPKTRKVMILDEPFRNLSEDNQEAASQMLKELSDKLGIQFIIVTHNQILTTYADKIYRLKQNKKKESIIIH